MMTILSMGLIYIRVYIYVYMFVFIYIYLIVSLVGLYQHRTIGARDVGVRYTESY